MGTIQGRGSPRQYRGNYIMGRWGRGWAQYREVAVPVNTGATDVEVG